MIIVSITGPTPGESLAQIRHSRKYSSIFEFRLDLMGSGSLDALIDEAKKPVVLTCRPTWEGGTFSGPDADRLALLREGCRLGAAYVDLEAHLGARVIHDFMSANPKACVIASRHFFDDRIPDAEREYRALRATGARVLKLAYRADDAADIGAALEFLARARKDRQRAVAIAMGEAGEPTRILYRKFGGWATYAAPLDGPPAAEGQIRADVLHTVFRADRLTRSTKVYGVIGDPVRFSKGIYIHNPLFQRAGKNAVYCRFAVRDLPKFMRTIAPGLHGMSVDVAAQTNRHEVSGPHRRLGAGHRSSEHGHPPRTSPRGKQH